MGDLKPKKIPVKSYEYEKDGKKIKVKRHLRTYYVKAKTKAKKVGSKLKRHRKKIAIGGGVLVVGVVGRKKKYDRRLYEAFSAFLKAVGKVGRRAPLVGEKVVRSEIRKLAEYLTKHAESKGFAVDVAEYGYHPNKRKGFIIIKFKKEEDAKRYYHRFIEPMFLTKRPKIKFSRGLNNIYIDLRF